MNHDNYTKYNKNSKFDRDRGERKELNKSNKDEKKIDEEVVNNFPRYELHVNQQRDNLTKIFVNVRKKPEDTGDIIDSLPEGTIIRVKRMVDAKWANVIFDDAKGNRKTGFMMREFMREVE